ncbi:MAG: phenylacetate--CoA ligase family protein [Chlorobi bacterium]|nr:phenylacetate--CoA ligase family protein [Chlorobiota bacterium]
MGFYGKILSNILLPLGDMLFGTRVMNELNTLRKVVQYSDKKISELQGDKISKLLNYCNENIPYYKEMNIKLEGNPFSDIKKFPILEKEYIRKYTEKLVFKKNLSKLIPQSSSGSTGKQTRVYWSEKEQDIHRATQLLWWEWAGYDLGDPILQTGITPDRNFVKKVKDILFRTTYIPAFSIDEETITSILNNVSGGKNILAGYASSLYVFSQIAEKHHIDIKFKTAISWGDKLFDHYRDNIERVFRCKVYETYGSGEGFMIAAQKDLEMMYIMQPNVYVEIVDDDGNEVTDGELGHVIVTNLNGFAMPLIRYRIGDLAVKLPKKDYPSGRELQLSILKRVIGRDTDIIKTRKGASMVVHSFTGIFEHYQSIKQFCVIQDNLDSITIEYIPDVNFKGTELPEIRSKIHKSLKDNDFRVEFKEVGKINATPSGKPQIIISKLKDKE